MINNLMLILGVSDAVRQMIVEGLLILLLMFTARTPRLR